MLINSSAQLVPLEKVLEKIIGGGTPSKQNPSFYQGTVPWATVKDLTKVYVDSTIDHISQDAISNSSTNLIEKGTVIVATRMALGKAFINLKDMAINQDLKALYPKDNVDNQYLLYSILFRAPQLQAMGSGTTVKGIRLDNLKKLPIVLVSYEEQQKIAAILSSVDDAIDKTEQIIEQMEHVKQGLMQQLLTRGIGHTEFKQTEIGEIPQDWDIQKIDEIAQINPDNLKDKDGEYEFNYIDIASINNGRIKETQKYKIKNAPSRAKRVVKSNDIIISTVRPYLKSFALIDSSQDGNVCSTGFAVIRSSNFVDSYYLFQLINHSHFVRHLVSNMTGSNYPAVNASHVKDYLAALPPLNEQVKIGEILKAFDHKLDLENNKLLVLENLKKGLMQQLLTGKVRVPVDENEVMSQ